VKKIIGLFAAIALVLGLSACTDDSDTLKNYKQSGKSTLKNSLEKKNLERRLQMEENPTRVGYVYLMSFSKPIGYYVIQGKVSSSGSQLAPEMEIIDPCSGSYCPTVVDGPQDDGTYGDGDPGIFFFTTNGTMVHTNLDYFYSTEPVPSFVDVPRLGGK
jgi:hypothetical protein